MKITIRLITVAALLVGTLILVYLYDTHAYRSSDIVHEQTYIYAPWRERYSKNRKSTLNKNCPFCSAIDTNVLLAKTQNFIIKLNQYPYTKGHILIIPHEHVARLSDLDSAMQNELTKLIIITSSILEKTLDCCGLNVGYNQGLCSGASVPDHLHIHVVPRYMNEHSFMDSVAQATVISWEWKELQALLKTKFKEQGIV